MNKIKSNLRHESNAIDAFSTGGGFAGKDAKPNEWIQWG